MDRTMMRRAAAVISVLGMSMVGLATLAPVASASATVSGNLKPGGHDLYKSSQTATFVDSSQDCNGTIPTHGSKSRDKFIMSDVSNFSSVDGGTVSYEFTYPGTPKTQGDAFAVRDCVAVYSPTSDLAIAVAANSVTFGGTETTPSGLPGSGNIDEVAPGNEPLFKDNSKLVLTQVEAQGVDHASYFDFSIKLPGGIAPGSLVCNFAKDIGGLDSKSNPHPDSDATEPGNGNRKAGACFTVPSGSLHVNKVVTHSSTTASFPITVTCGDSTYSISLANGQSQTLNDLAVGAHCTVNETDSMGATVTYSSPNPAVIQNGQTATVTVTNAYPPTGSLTVRKVLVNNTSTAPFNVTVTCGNFTTSLSLAGGSSQTLTGLPVGTCTVHETDSRGATVTYSASTTQTNGDVTITEGQTSTETVTNTGATTTPTGGSLTVTKVVVNSSTTAQFTITVTCGEHPPITVTLTGGHSQTLTGLPVGTCTVHETDGQGASVTYLASTNQTDGHVTITDGHTSTETVTNTFPARGSLTVSKVVHNGTINGPFTIVVTCGDDDPITLTLNGGQSTTLNDLPVGTCNVTETDAKGAAVTYSTETDEGGGGSVSIVNGQTATETVTNTYPVTGNLKVAKVVSGSSTTSDFTIDVQCGESATQHLELANGEDVTLTGLAPGTICVVHETDSQGATVTYSDVAGNGHATVAGGQTVTETVTNTFTPPPVIPQTPGATAPDLSLVKTGPTEANVGSTLSYVLTVTNTGTAATAGPTTVTDTVDGNTNLVSASETSGPAGSCTVSGGVATCTLTESLPINGVARFTVTVSIPADSKASSVTDTAVVKNSSILGDTDDTSTLTTKLDQVEATGGTKAPSVTPPAVVPPAVVPPAVVLPKAAAPVAVLPLTGVRTLPFTGTNVRLLLLAGLGLLLLGLGLVAGTFRRPGAHHYR